ncbi:MAG: acylphosphatase [Chloroflexi bacterium]|nr:acylphosphatase [Chloroflexota bacterium]
MKRVQVRLYGRVQGVGLRVFVLRQAQHYGLSGTVRNVYFPRQYVEVVAEGETAPLESFLAQLQIGPAMAHIERFDSTWAQATGAFSAFSIIQ